MNRSSRDCGTVAALLLMLALACFAFSPTARAVDPPPDGGYPNQNTAEGDDALFSLNTPANGTWTATGSLHIARYLHTATLLANGQVLVAAGLGESISDLASAELYDPASGTWTRTGNLANARESYTATLLPNGKVLVAGGYNRDGSGTNLASAELYDPATGTWTATGSLVSARSGHTATLLSNGEVLVAGGYDVTYLASAELYDPATGTWTATGSLITARAAPTATLLPNGKVLVAAGEGESSSDLASAELYDPATGTWSATGSLKTMRRVHAAALLPNGQVLVAAGYNFTIGYLASAELYDSTSGTWTATGSLKTARYLPTATLLPDGGVLIVGGSNQSGYVASAELHPSGGGSWMDTGSLITGRVFHTATLLPNGQVLVAGGFNAGALSSAELYTSDSGADLTLVSAASVKGPFAIDLPLTGPSGVEDRSGGPDKKYTVVLTFDQNIVSVGSASSTCGTVLSIVIDSSDAHKVNLNLVNVARACNGSTITVTANSITDDQGNVLDSASVGLGLLLGDVNADRVVNRSDYIEAQMHKGQKTDQQNLRSDVNADGHIKPSDTALIWQQQGTSLP